MGYVLKVNDSQVLMLTDFGSFFVQSSAETPPPEVFRVSPPAIHGDGRLGAWKKTSMQFNFETSQVPKPGLHHMVSCLCFSSWSEGGKATCHLLNCL